MATARFASSGAAARSTTSTRGSGDCASPAADERAGHHGCVYVVRDLPCDPADAYRVSGRVCAAAGRQLWTCDLMAHSHRSRHLHGLLQRLRHAGRDRDRAGDAKRKRLIGGTAGRCLPGRQGLAWCGCTVRTQHPRHSRVGSRSRWARASRSPTSSSTTRVAGVGACCCFSDGWASVSRGNSGLRILLCGSPLLRIEVQSSRCCARALSLSGPQRHRTRLAHVAAA
jgi:hypothetical protein